ncbi:hypothetical protein [Tannerella forsythia]|uniref:hypothetical protein n=1 Tax=Tannerella forsythia TaxID=28112 RepID=UPI000AEADB1A|nr:hypothetical protein [Tannerella forsythia]
MFQEVIGAASQRWDCGAAFSLRILPISFVWLMITWIGVNYLPAAQGSIHVY